MRTPTATPVPSDMSMILRSWSDLATRLAGYNRIVTRAAVLALLAGCYQPTAPQNAPCGPNGECPSGQACMAGICGGEVSPIDSSTAIDGSSGDGAPGDGTVDGRAPDAMLDAPNACAGGDMSCLVECVSTDPDCQTTCGDGRCVGNAGELCSNCNADCKTRNPVCGNGACDPGESPSCYADCGPSPWTWSTDEQMLIAGINNRRVMGANCGNGTTTAPALTYDPNFDGQVHEWVWEVAHQNVFTNGGGACNGRTNAERQTPTDFDAWVSGQGYADVAATLTGWFNDNNTCGLLMNASRTKIGAGVAKDVAKSYIVIMK